ncbi:ABC transporter permease [Luteolibacter ambystomatis]|uniref:ABC transporter permease n=1 Tax=Luteolibacter ambystomatis TaxID=2824561 RepID=A0A975G8X1_9BACT|nr:ABC transporter permease [Luteolibacter ambystomatis]QUE50921.1 ABC transporter permease [Luteolibacter ambystomatis]
MSLRSVFTLLGPFLALIVIYSIFGAMRPVMFSSDVMLSVLTQTVIVATAAIGMTLIIISGGIDLSVGSIIAFACVVAATLITKGYPPVAVFAATIGFGALCGLFNGSLTVGLKLLPFIVTLGTMQIFRGGAKVYSHGSPVNLPFDVTVYKAWMGGKGLPYGVWMMIGLVVLFTVILRYTRFGRYVFAVGSNENTATLCGVNVPKVKLLVYTIGGAMAGLAAMMNVAKSSQGDPTTAMGLELDVIAAVVIGGASLSGGEGSVLGALIGALLMTTIRTGCVLRGIPTPWTEIITGAIIVIAVIIDRLRHRTAA